jgi:putative transposase
MRRKASVSHDAASIRRLRKDPDFAAEYLKAALEDEDEPRVLLIALLTARPTAAWTLQQLREAIPSDHSYRFLIRDRDSIFSGEVDQQLKTFGVRVLRTPVRAPKANAYRERLVGSIRPECLDFMIPLGEKHVRRILEEWVTHYNKGRPNLNLGPGIPEPAAVGIPRQGHDRHSFAQDCKVAARAVLGGLHHEHGWETIAA